MKFKIRSRIVRDTIFLTFIQLILDSSALLLNTFITRKLGTTAIGILSLMGSFLSLAVISCGNAYLCTNRLISEELGSENGNPDRVLFHALRMCGFLSITVSFIIFTSADFISEKFFSGADMARAVRLMPPALISGAISACFKGYFNACRKSSTGAFGDVLEFAVKACVIVVLTLSGWGDVCSIMIISIIAGNFSSLCYFLSVYLVGHKKSSHSGNMTFWNYVKYAIPIMGGGILTSVLSSTNDALIPMCLKQYGDSVNEALSLFGIFEAIVIPTLFFPSVVLCSVSGIVVSEIARAKASGNRERIESLTSRLISLTLIYAIFSASVLMKFGKPVGVLLGGGELAGKIITFIAPVVPFIYMEIILEAIIKGLGLQGFSSLNYLAEYVVRITIVLILVPKTGFWGIALSYYASNIFGNCMRFVKILKQTVTPFRPVKDIIFPVLYSFLTMNASELLLKISGIKSPNVLGMIIFTLVWLVLYGSVFLIIGREPDKKLTIKVSANT